MARKAIDRARLTLAAMKRCGNGHLLPKGRGEIAARFGREFAEPGNSTDGAEVSARSTSGAPQRHEES